MKSILFILMFFATTCAGQLISKSPQKSYDYGRYILSVGPSVVSSIALITSIEVINRKNQIGYRPYIISPTIQSDFIPSGVGFATRFYLTRQSPMRLVIGPSIDYINWRTTKSHERSEDAFVVLGSAGLSFQPGKHINLGVDGGVGLGIVDASDILPTYRMGINLGFRF